MSYREFFFIELALLTNKLNFLVLIRKQYALTRLSYGRVKVLFYKNKKIDQFVILWLSGFVPCLCLCHPLTVQLAWLTVGGICSGRERAVANSPSAFLHGSPSFALQNITAIQLTKAQYLSFVPWSSPMMQNVIFVYCTVQYLYIVLNIRNASYAVLLYFQCFCGDLEVRHHQDVKKNGSPFYILVRNKACLTWPHVHKL